MAIYIYIYIYGRVLICDPPHRTLSAYVYVLHSSMYLRSRQLNIITILDNISLEYNVPRSCQNRCSIPRVILPRPQAVIPKPYNILSPSFVRPLKKTARSTGDVKPNEYLFGGWTGMERHIVWGFVVWSLNPARFCKKIFGQREDIIFS